MLGFLPISEGPISYIPQQTTADVVVPVMTGVVTISSITSSGFTASWSAATDNVGVAGYEISVDTGTPSYSSVGNVLITTKIGLSSTTLYSVRVRAFDSSGNRSTPLLTTVATSTAVSSNLLQNTSNNLVVTTPTITALTSSNTSITYNKHTGQVLVLYNSSGSNVTVNIKGSATNNIPIPNAAGTTISLTTGMNIIVASGMFTWVMLDKCYAYLSGDVTITASVDNAVMSCLMVR